MKLTYLYSLAVIALALPSFSFALIGGSPLSQAAPGLVSSVVLIRSDGRQNAVNVCTGVVIAPDRIATAAHCAQTLVRRGQNLIIHMAGRDSEPFSFRGGMHINPDYDPNRPDSDFAVIILPPEVAKTMGRPVDRCVMNGRIIRGRIEIFAAGYGRRNDSAASSTGSAYIGWLSDGSGEIEGNVCAIKGRSRALRDLATKDIDTGIIASGDSGGPVFLRQQGGWCLTGIMQSMFIVRGTQDNPVRDNTCWTSVADQSVWDFLQGAGVD